MGEMQSKLLQKVEELTLYVIELKKENQKLQDRVTALESK
jgi:cell division protein FtsB